MPPIWPPVIVIVPGPTVTLIIANSLRHGTRAGLLNMLGTQLGLAVMIGVVGIGLTSLIEAMGHWFDWLRLAGAAYLVWLGWKMIRSSGEGDEAAVPRPPRGGFLLQGVLVALSNPKTLVFFGAFFPQFIDPARDHGTQILIMGLTAMLFAVLSDSASYGEQKWRRNSIWSCAAAPWPTAPARALREADVAVKDGKIAAVGKVSGKGAEEIDAKGLLVTPGFVDIHTHYDGQATWDSHLQPSSWHGVTTAVMGNCGVGFAPVQDRGPPAPDRADGRRRGHSRRRARRGAELVVGIVRPVSRSRWKRGRATWISAPSCRTARCACS